MAIVYSDAVDAAYREQIGLLFLTLCQGMSDVQPGYDRPTADSLKGPVTRFAAGLKIAKAAHTAALACEDGNPV